MRRDAGRPRRGVVGIGAVAGDREAAPGQPDAEALQLQAGVGEGARELGLAAGERVARVGGVGGDRGVDRAAGDDQLDADVAELLGDEPQPHFRLAVGRADLHAAQDLVDDRVRVDVRVSRARPAAVRQPGFDRAGVVHADRERERRGRLRRGVGRDGCAGAGRRRATADRRASRNPSPKSSRRPGRARRRRPGRTPPRRRRRSGARRHGGRCGRRPARRPPERSAAGRPARRGPGCGRAGVSPPVATACAGWMATVRPSPRARAGGEGGRRGCRERVERGAEEPVGGGRGRTCFRRVGVRALSCDHSDRCPRVSVRHPRRRFGDLPEALRRGPMPSGRWSRPVVPSRWPRAPG